MGTDIPDRSGIDKIIESMEALNRASTSIENRVFSVDPNAGNELLKREVLKLLSQIKEIRLKVVRMLGESFDRCEEEGCGGEVIELMAKYAHILEAINERKILDIIRKK